MARPFPAELLRCRGGLGAAVSCYSQGGGGSVGSVGDFLTLLLVFLVAACRLWLGSAARRIW